MTDEWQTQYLNQREREITTRLNVAAVSRFIEHVHEDQDYLLDTVARLRKSLKQCRSHWGGYCVTKDEQYKSLMEDFWAHIRKCDVLIDTALAEEKPNER